MLHREADLALFYFDLAVREIERVTRGRVSLVIVHRYGGAAGAMATGGGRSRRLLPGTEIVSAWLIFRGKQYRLPLSTPHMIVLHYLCSNCARGIGQNAGEVEAGLNEQLFYIHHASSAKRRGMVLARSSRTNVKKVVERIRKVMADLFEKEHLPLDPKAILRSEPTSTREIRYSIWANIHFEGQ